MKKMIIKKECNVYSFSELTERERDRVVNEYLEYERESEIFTEMCEDKLYRTFPHSDLKVQYSLSYCQGDGLNIYGTLNLEDALKKVKNKLSKEDVLTIKMLINMGTLDSEYELRENRRYCYCIAYTINLQDAALDELDVHEKHVILKFSHYVRKYISHLCSELEVTGYNYFYELTDDDRDYLNQQYYLEGGKMVDNIEDYEVIEND